MATTAFFFSSFFPLTPEFIRGVFGGLASGCAGNGLLAYILPSGGGPLAGKERSLLRLAFPYRLALSDEPPPAPGPVIRCVLRSLHGGPAWQVKLGMHLASASRPRDGERLQQESQQVMCLARSSGGARLWFV